MLLQPLHKPVAPQLHQRPWLSVPSQGGGALRQTADASQAPAGLMLLLVHIPRPRFSATPLLPIMLWPKSLHHFLTLLRSPRALCEGKQIKTGEKLISLLQKKEWDYPLSCLRAFRTPVNSFSASSEMDVISINNSISLLQVYNPGPPFSRVWEPPPGVWSLGKRLSFYPQILWGSGPWL